MESEFVSKSTDLQKRDLYVRYEKEELEDLREGVSFEAKLASGRDGRGAVPKTMWETYSAMANTSGGAILLGAKERRDGSLEAWGIQDIEKVERELWNLLQNPQKVSTNLLRDDDVRRVETDEKTLLLLRVPKAARSQRPVFINGSVETGTYVRVHEGDRLVSAENARRMWAERTPDADSLHIDDFGVDDLDEPSVRRYREIFTARRPEHPFLEKRDEDFLLAINVLYRERTSGNLHPTKAGLWMLGKENSIRELYPGWHLSYKEIPENPSTGERWADRVHPDGSWNANLFQFYLKVINKLHDGLKTPFSLEGGQFRVDETPIHGALREALVNALIHADYFGNTGVRVVRRRSSFEFINPGMLLVEPEQLWRGGVSVPRNPTLHRLFGFLKLGEREGSGGPEIRRVWRSQDWKVPYVKEVPEHLETHLTLPQESLFPESVVSSLAKEFGQRFTEQDELGRAILVAAAQEGHINRKGVREFREEHPRDITLKFQELMRCNVLAFRENSNRDYVLNAHVRSSGVHAVSSEANAVSSGAANAVSSGANAASSEAHAVSSESDENKLSVLEQVQQSRRAKPELVKQAILELCRGDYLTVKEIANALGRKEDTVRTRYIPMLVRERLLEQRFPAKPNHPSQAYRTLGSV